LSSNLTGRFHQINIFPFSFKEIKSFKPDYQLSQYLISGGYPEVIINGLDPKSYLSTLFESILFKDVTKRYNLRHPQKIYDLALYLLTNFSSIYSYHKLKTAINLSSVATVEKYVNLLEQTFLLFSLNRFDFKLKKQFGYGKKIYSVDNGLAAAVSFQNSENLGRLLENAVFGDFLRRGLEANKDIFYYKTKSGKEVDFVIKSGLKIEKLVQVVLSLKDPKTRKREISALVESSDELNCKNLEIVTFDEEGKEGEIKITSAFKNKQHETIPE
jgi:predicted AAA+ superfamily ATPase